MKSLQGQLLIASPRLQDPNFFRTVVLLVQHGEEGAMGLILNRPLDTTVKAAWMQVAESDCTVDGQIHEGGPCEGPLIVLHTHEPLSDMQIIPGLFFSAERDTVQELVMINPGPTKFVVNYAGWTAGQLESEMDEGSWLLFPATVEIAFDESDDLWHTLFNAATKAITFAGLTPKTIPEDPSMN